MQRNRPVADLEIEETTGRIRKIYGVWEAERLPVGVTVRKGVPDRAALNEWWADRAIPMERRGVREAILYLGVSDTAVLPAAALGMSLSDAYWIRPEGSGATWEEKNFFTNPFRGDVGEALLGKFAEGETPDLYSPDNTTDGYLIKRWEIIDGKRYLLKGGSPPFYQQPFCEAAASEIMDRLGIDHVPYSLVVREGEPYSLCEDLADQDRELVSAWRIMQTRKKSSSTSVYRHFVDCCQALGAGDVTEALNRMIVLDYIIANEDRHLSNFGLLRDTRTLSWIGFAPVYDSGSSLGYNKTANQIRGGTGIQCKPFKKNHEDQLKLAGDLSWVNFTRLADIEDWIRDRGRFLDEDRREAICRALRGRIDRLKEQASRGRSETMMNTEGDVERDLREDYRI